MKNSCLGVFLIVLFILFFTATVFLFSVQATLLNPNFYKKQLDKIDFYNRGSELIVDLYAQESGSASLDEESYQAFLAAIKKTITADYLKEEIESVLDGADEFLSSSSREPNIVFDMERIKPVFVDNLYQEVNARQPMTRSQFDIYVYSEIKSDVDQIFVKYDLKSLKEKDPITYENNVSQIKTAVGAINTIKYFSLIISIILLLLIVLLAKSELKAALRWPGYALGISGLLLILTSIIFGPIASFMQGQLLTATDGLKESGNLLYELTNQVMRASAGVLMWISAVVFVVGLVMIILSYFVKNNSPVSQAPAQK